MGRTPAVEHVRVATFNCENLFARYRFKANVDPSGADGFTVNELAFEIYNEAEKRITARAIGAANADIIAIQEAESLPILDRFHSTYLRGHLKNRPYLHRVLIDGNDPRHIDVAILSRYPILHVRSHRHERNAARTAELFSRDCLVVTIDVVGKPLTLYVNHLKSMMEGRSETRARRLEQAQRVATIVDEDWAGKGYEGSFIVLGDLNDQWDNERKSGIGPLLTHPQLVNVLDRLPKEERWTHYFARGKKGEKATQLDYILVSRALDERAGKPRPKVIREGLPWRAEDYTGDRFDEVGEHEPKASDHCPLYVDLPIAAL